MIEFTQFKSLVRTCGGELADETMTEHEEKFLQLPNIPKSSIVYPIEDEDVTKVSLKDLKIRAYTLYCKYIDTLGVFCLNISSSVRHELMRKMADPQSWLDDNNKVTNADLFHLFDRCLRELYSLQKNDSFARFQLTQVFLFIYLFFFLLSLFAVRFSFVFFVANAKCLIGVPERNFDK
ncbi:hypothetical protein RFI_00199 [Reticulomyxa filosa]|uniref:RGS domain-containing protein n=1 Tax=Reticulomyxa filosa TaxID=46433 RepID=X6PEF6_RETFI|nr:hypothetical protein RFI_00199 [Reticulomyxa filosa]|eukprot:ETO36865.1 hypothetical protein RFI_00199 [Reticulomyxa filosa]